MTVAFQNAVAAVQNPAFGATLLWRFGLGYQDEAAEAPLMLLHFLVLPLVLHAPTLALVVGTRPSSSVALFASKLADQREELVAVHERALKLRALTLESLSAGVTARLLSVDYDVASVRSNEARQPTPPERLKQHFSAAEKLGRWFARTPADQTFTLLRVEV